MSVLSLQRIVFFLPPRPPDVEVVLSKLARLHRLAIPADPVGHGLYRGFHITIEKQSQTILSYVFAHLDTVKYRAWNLVGW